MKTSITLASKTSFQILTFCILTAIVRTIRTLINILTSKRTITLHFLLTNRATTLKSTVIIPATFVSTFSQISFISTLVNVLFTVVSSKPGHAFNCFNSVFVYFANTSSTFPSLYTFGGSFSSALGHCTLIGELLPFLLLNGYVFEDLV
jgi:hypothetical protein